MHRRSLRRAATIALAAVLAVAGTVAADTVRSDGDVVAPGAQTLVDLGTVAPSAEVVVEVAFELVCSNVRHVDPGQSITLTWSSQSVPTGGAVLAASPATVGPVPADWPAETMECPDPLPVLASSTSSVVRLRAPAVENVGYMYTVVYSRAIGPAGSDDARALSGTGTAINFRLAVRADTPPVLTVPAPFTVEGDTAGGWTAAYLVTATDAQDDPDPVPSCTPAVGTVLPLGTTTVRCAAQDSAGQVDMDTFDVTVVDTTDPILDGLPTDVAVTTGDPTGADVSWAAPTASDIVDGAPASSCLPASGGRFPVGSTIVSCTATDASGNVASGSFVVTVSYLPPVTADAVWHEPLPADGSSFVANRGRTIPVKVTLRVDGDVRTTGDAALGIVACPGGPARHVPLAFAGGRWTASLDTSMLSGSCYDVHATIDGLDAGSVRLEIRGLEPTRAKGNARAR